MFSNVARKASRKNGQSSWEHFRFFSLESDCLDLQSLSETQLFFIIIIIIGQLGLVMELPRRARLNPPLREFLPTEGMGRSLRPNVGCL